MFAESAESVCRSKTPVGCPHPFPHAPSRHMPSIHTQIGGLTLLRPWIAVTRPLHPHNPIKTYLKKRPERSAAGAHGPQHRHRVAARSHTHSAHPIQLVFFFMCPFAAPMPPLPPFTRPQYMPVQLLCSFTTFASWSRGSPAASLGECSDWQKLNHPFRRHTAYPMSLTRQGSEIRRGLSSTAHRGRAAMNGDFDCHRPSATRNSTKTFNCSLCVRPSDVVSVSGSEVGEQGEEGKGGVVGFCAGRMCT